ncbi:MAG: hypothetical protein U0414_06690 [Polyangiaceae bacterium]
MPRLAALVAATTLAFSALAPEVARADDDPLWIPSFRGAIGPAFRIGPDKGVGLSGDIGGGFIYPFAGGRGVFDAEIGYAYDDLGFDAFAATFGVGVNVLGDERNQMLYLLYQAHLIVGTFADHTGAGMRNGISAHALFDTFTLEFGHQFVNEGVTLHHDVRLLVGINLVAPIYLVARRFGP